MTIQPLDNRELETIVRFVEMGGKIEETDSIKKGKFKTEGKTVYVGTSEWGEIYWVIKKNLFHCSNS